MPARTASAPRARCPRRARPSRRWWREYARSSIARSTTCSRRRRSVRARSCRRAGPGARAQGGTGRGEADKALKEAEARLTNARENRIRAEGAGSQARQARERVVARVREKLDCALDDVLEAAEIGEGQELPPREEVEAKLARLVRERDNMGAVNLRAEVEARELDEQIVGMQSERSDLVNAIARLRQGIASLNREGRERLLAAFEAVNTHFQAHLVP